MTEFEAQVLTDLSALKSQMQQLLGIGQPGRIALLEERVQRHEQAVMRFKGMTAALGALLTVLHITIDLLAGRR